MKLRHLLCSICFLPVSLFAGISGNYLVTGLDKTVEPPQPYTGSAIISKQGSGKDAVYTIVWNYPNSDPFYGTGVREGDAVSFVYNEECTSYYGVQLYDIKNRGDVLDGKWVDFQASAGGFETLEKVELDQ